MEGRRPAKPAAELTAEDLGGLATEPRSTFNRLLFPSPTREFTAHREQFGDTSVLPSKEFLYGLRPGDEHAVDLEPGVRLLMGIEAISEPDQRGVRTVMCTLNGQLRPISVRDRNVDAQVKTAEKADRALPGHIPAPFAGVVTLKIAEDDRVKAGQPVATIEAMKMEATITAPIAGTVARVAIGPVQQVEGGDLLLVLDPPAVADAPLTALR